MVVDPVARTETLVPDPLPRLPVPVVIVDPVARTAPLVLARNILVAIGIFHILFYGFQIPRLPEIAENDPIPMDAEGNPPSDEVVAEVRARLITGYPREAWGHMGLGAAFLMVAFILPIAPGALVTVAALSYVALQISLGIMEPTTILSGLVLKLGVVVGLFTATRKILEAETGERAF